MKIIQLKEHLQIVSPWLNKEEAAQFLGISDSFFYAQNKQLPCPHGGPASCARFYTPVLTAWWEKIALKEREDTNG